MLLVQRVETMHERSLLKQCRQYFVEILDLLLAHGSNIVKEVRRNNDWVTSLVFCQPLPLWAIAEKGRGASKSGTSIHSQPTPTAQISHQIKQNRKHQHFYNNPILDYAAGTPTAMNSVASKRLFQEYKHLTTDPPEGITAGPVNEDDLFLWEAMIQGPEGTPYEGGVFPAELKFPKDYPLMPPTMKFQCDIWHPNGKLLLFSALDQQQELTRTTVYANGVVCISILHPPGDDPNHYEQASERWSPIQSVEKILISVMSMIAEPNDESPANVDAARMWRERRSEFESRVKADVRKSLGL
ncbi:hypothetical protein Q7P37_001013 [Cladosporium fusiforme]